MDVSEGLAASSELAAYNLTAIAVWGCGKDTYKKGKVWCQNPLKRWECHKRGYNVKGFTKTP